MLRRAQRKLRRGERAQTTRIASFGPLVSVFFYFSCFLYILNHFYRFYVNMEVQMDTQEGTTRKTSPNDAIRVVWAISTCFLFLFQVFFFTDLYLQVLQVYGATDRLTEGYDKKNGPKRTRIASFGPFISLLLLLFVFFTYTDHITRFCSYY